MDWILLCFTDVGILPIDFHDIFAADMRTAIDALNAEALPFERERINDMIENAGRTAEHRVAVTQGTASCRPLADQKVAEYIASSLLLPAGVEDPEFHYDGGLHLQRGFC